jgi:hypothetical protein
MNQSLLYKVQDGPALHTFAHNSIARCLVEIFQLLETNTEKTENKERRRRRKAKYPNIKHFQELEPIDSPYNHLSDKRDKPSEHDNQ